jgi:hypothetical protein
LSGELRMIKMMVVVVVVVVVMFYMIGYSLVKGTREESHTKY